MANLFEIPWREKRVASGMADHVPEALIGLLSPDESVRERSYWRLDNEVVLQSDLYEAAYFVVPFLIRLLDEKVEYGRTRIYDLLYEIANGYAPPTAMCRTNEGHELPLMEACRLEVNKGVRVFLRDVADGEPQISAKAKELVELLDVDESR